jgi:hypothetical protein
MHLREFTRILLTQFHNQFEAAERPTPRERIGIGKISPTATQADGPQVIAKENILMQMKATIALVADWLWFSTFPAVVPMIATIN